MGSSKRVCKKQRFEQQPTPEYEEREDLDLDTESSIDTKDKTTQLEHKEKPDWNKLVWKRGYLSTCPKCVAKEPNHTAHFMTKEQLSYEKQLCEKKKRQQPYSEQHENSQKRSIDAVECEDSEFT